MKVNDTRYNRDSGIELLRIIIMFMILLLHANHTIFGSPEHPFSAIGISRNILESFTQISVNVFVLITGFYGTNFKLYKAVNLLFQCAFCVFLLALTAFVTGIFKFDSINVVVKSLNFFKYWFIIAYIGMMAITPFINTSLQKMPQRTYLYSLIIAYCIFGLGDFFHVNNMALGINGGYTTLWFILLYITGQYISRFPFSLSKRHCIIGILICITVQTFLFCPIEFLGISYCNPAIYVESILFFIIFSKIHFTSKTINFIAASTTMVYLLNTNIFAFQFFKTSIIDFFDQHSMFIASTFTLMLCIAYFVSAILIDQIRKWLWSLIKFQVVKVTKNFESRFQ